MNINLLKLDPVSRRVFVERLAKTTLGVTVLPMALQAEDEVKPDSSKLPGFGKAKNVIWLQMIGGMSHIDTLDPKTGETKGPGDPITTKAGYQLGGYLPKLAENQSGNVTIIRSMSSKTGVHADGQYIMRTGYEKRGTIQHPNLGAWAQNILGVSNKSLPSSVCINRRSDHGNGFLSSAYSPLPILDPDSGLQYARMQAEPELVEKRLTLLTNSTLDFARSFRTSTSRITRTSMMTPSSFSAART